MTSRSPLGIRVEITANFESSLAEIEAFLDQAEASQAFDALLEELTATVIPNLERFPGMGRSFLERAVRSVEVSNGLDALQGRLGALGDGVELREYMLSHYVLLYARLDQVIHLLSIRHHRQLHFDFQSRRSV